MEAMEFIVTNEMGDTLWTFETLPEAMKYLEKEKENLRKFYAERGDDPDHWACDYPKLYVRLA